MRVVVTGASRGIGLELVRQLVWRGAEIDAAVRRPAAAPALAALARRHAGQVRVHTCDVASDAGVERFGEALRGVPVDVLVNNAGVPPVRDTAAALAPGDDVLALLNVNAVGALRVTRALLPNLRAGTGRLVVHIGSVLGSITDVPTGDSVGYRMSKAALNMASRALARGLEDEGIASVVVHPGWVQTDMGGPRAPVPVERSVAGIVRLLERLGLRDTGRFMDYRGRALRF